MRAVDQISFRQESFTPSPFRKRRAELLQASGDIQRYGSYVKSMMDEDPKWDQLPPEVLANIFQFLEPADVHGMPR